jgi:hypothetical protein
MVAVSGLGAGMTVADIGFFPPGELRRGCGRELTDCHPTQVREITGRITPPPD